jgi:sugar phosphate isomerase/epimerase
VRLSIVVSTQPASFSALAYKGDLEATLAKVQRLGYDGVELAVRNPGLLDAGFLERRLSALALPVCAIGTGQAFGEEGLSLTCPDKVLRERAVARMMAQADLGRTLGAAVIVGLIRGRIGEGGDPTSAEERLAESMGEIAKKNPDVRFCVEPINRYETDMFPTAESVLRFLNRLGRDNVGLLLDTFHMNIEESDSLAAIAAAKDRLFHIHIADSNRRHPGAGHIDFQKVVGKLADTGYRGYLSAEILPYPDPDEAAKNTIEHMRGCEARPVRTPSGTETENGKRSRLSGRK